MLPGKPKYNLINTDDDPIPENEPVFIVRAQDTIGLLTVRFYAMLARHHLHDPRLAAEVERHADLFEVWPTRKRPD
jgi:hypothetical protein